MIKFLERKMKKVNAERILSSTEVENSVAIKFHQNLNTTKLKKLQVEHQKNYSLDFQMIPILLFVWILKMKKKNM